MYPSNNHAPAIYECTQCHTVRNYGNGTPEDASVKPTIGCTTCKKQTQHTFKGCAAVFSFSFD